MPAILDRGWRIGISHIILKVGQPKIISDQISEQILMWFFFSHNNGYKYAERKISKKNLEFICWTTHCHVTAFKIWAHFDL
jgi:hypothetical protein